MILRKPYAFLIKYFKLIHLFITLLLIYVTNKTVNTHGFFKKYIANSLIEVVPNSYINFFIYLFIILIITLSITIIILLKKKDKPILFYIITIIACIFIFGSNIYLKSILNTLEFGTLDRKTISFAKDISLFNIIFEFILLIPYIIRTLGFDIKKFDFKKDLQELDIEETDNEEFELNIELDKNKIERKTRRRIRELKYYYLENKIFILIVLGIISFIIGISLVSKINIITKYKENDVIKLDTYYNITITDSYITDTSDAGKIVSVNNNTYLIVKFNITSKYEKAFTLDTNKFLIKIKKEHYIADKSYYTYFSSYGTGYKNQKINLNDKKEFILTYSIPKEYSNKNILLEYNYRFDKNGEMIKKIVKLSPEIKE